MKAAFLFAAFLITLAAVPLAAQETPVATLVDEFRTVGNCERGLAATDNFMSELGNNPASQGYVVIYREGDRQNSARGRRREIENWVKTRQYDPSRITFLDGTVQVEAKTQFWLVPPGAEAPGVEPDDPKAVEMPQPAAPAATDPTKPYIFTAEYSDGIDGCKDPFDKEGFAQTLKDEPGARGNIVIRANDRAAYRKAEREILAELASLGVKVSRLKTFYVKDSLFSIELWFLPRRPTSNPLIGTWRQTKAVPCRGKAYTMAQVAGIEEFILGDDGSFSVTGRPFETYKDYWGKYTYDAKTGVLKFTVERGN